MTRTQSDTDADMQHAHEPDGADGNDDWIECWNCGGEGQIEDEDWQFEGDFYTCDICEGHGGWRPNV